MAAALLSSSSSSVTRGFPLPALRLDLLPEPAPSPAGGDPDAPLGGPLSPVMGLFHWSVRRKSPRKRLTLVNTETNLLPVTLTVSQSDSSVVVDFLLA